MHNFQKGTAGIELIIYIVLLGIMLIAGMMWDSYSCNSYGSLTDRTVKYSFVSGCYVKTPSGWIPEDEMSKRAYGNSIKDEE